MARDLLVEKIIDIEPGTGWHRLEQQVDCLVSNNCIEQLAWLAAGRGVRTFWANRKSSLISAGQGVALSIRIGDTVPPSQVLRESEPLMREVLAACPNARFYGGMAFSEQAGDHWSGFGGGQILLPRFELLSYQGQLILACNLQLPLGSQGVALKKQIAIEAQTLAVIEDLNRFPKTLPVATVTGNIPVWATWEAQVDTVLEALEKRNLAKVVLSREQTLSIDGELCPWSMLMRWQAMTPETYRFALWNNHNECFFGASPESLYHRHKQNLDSEALAGTAPRGRTPVQDRKLAANLLADDKNRRENSLVMRAITDALSECSESVEFTADTNLVKLRSVQHLRKKVRAYLKPDTTDAELIERLHPTPAMGGAPKAEALSLIQRLETHQRGWYSGPFGMIEKDGADISVAIRCALLQGQSLRLYSGVGLVPGSHADEEWAELDSKLKTVQSLLNVKL